MRIEYTGRKVNLKDNFKEMTEKKLKKFNKMFSDDAVAHVTVTLEKNRQTVEITIRDGSIICRSEAVCREMNDSLDKVIENLGRQIRKNKTRLEKKLRSAALNDFVINEPVEKEDEGELKYDVVKTKSFDLHNMTVEEAILQMNMLDHTFFMFKNGETGDINVVYTRKDGNYAVLSPQD